ncbi:GNAT family N-acetyltransferase [Paenibacillus pinihumi]|uniref:GNAT family N-acetyltransferase n=1 Tax=Paenibacillus pinihumi TaxID=669462 RepID=UPI00041F04F1|nr:GNAT family N-acetyltransferase [Paenibacillus pinihumi]
MIIREASLDEVWQLRHEVMWPDQELSFVQLKDDANGRHFGLYVNDTLVSVISLFPEGTRAQFRKFATLREEQGKGYGSRLLAYTLEEARRLGADAIWCNARASKVSFYQKFGLEPTLQTFQKAGVNYVILEKSLL